MLTTTLRRSYTKQQFVQKVTEGAFQSVLLQNSYLSNPSEQARDQWVGAYNTQIVFLQGAAPLFTSAEEKKLFKDIENVYLDTKILFDDLVYNINRGNSETVVQELNTRLTLKIQARVAGSMGIAELSRQEVINTEWSLSILLLLLGLIIIGTSAWFSIVSIAIAGSLQALHDGVLLIAGGQLNYRVNIANKDEIGEVAQSFNKMAAAVENTIENQKRLSREKDEFLAIASHELRTPLIAIKGNLELIQDFFAGQFKDERLREMLKDAHAGAARVIEVVQTFIDLTRLELGEVKIKKEKADLAALVYEVFQDFKTVIEEKGIFLKMDVAEQPCYIVADSMRVKQVISSLISNSVHYTNKGGITVSIKKHPTMAEVFVADTGIGIEADRHEDLFKKFKSAERSVLSRDISKGMGLGLYISKLLVEYMGGEMYLDKSKLGEGSVFRFTIPTAQ